MYFIDLKKKTAMYCVAIVILILCIVYIYKVVSLNKNNRECKYLDYNIGQEFEYKECNIVLDNFCINDLDEFMQKYNVDKEIFEYYGDSENYRILTIECNIEKNTDDAEGINWTEAYLFTDTWFNQFDIDIFSKINTNNKPYSKVKKGEKNIYIVPFIINKSTITKKEWTSIDKMNFWIEIPDYYESQYIRRINI